MNSDDESSSSSNEFLVSPDKINLDSPFFKEPKPNLKSESLLTSKDSEDEFEDVNNTNSVEVITQTLKNLENWEKHESAAKQQEGNDANKEEEKKKKISRSGLLSNEIQDLLLLGETPVTLSNYKVEHDDTESDTDADMDESEAQQTSEYIIPEGGVTITLPGNNIMFKRKKRNHRDLETLLKNRMNQELRTNQLLIHKVGLLCWLSHGFHLNQLVNAPDILSAAAAKVSSSSYPKGRLDLAYLEKLTGWFCNSFILMNNDDALITNESLLCAIKNKKVADYKELVLLFVATLRGIGINCRLVLNLCAPPLKVNRDQLFQTKQEPSSSKDKVKEEPSSNTMGEKNTKGSKTKKMTKSIKRLKSSKTVSSSRKSSEKKVSPSKVAENTLESLKNAKIEARKKAVSILKNNLEATTSKIITKRVTKENKESKDNVMSPKVLKLRTRVIVGKDSKDSNDMKKKSSKSNAEENKLAQKLEETRELRSRNAKDKKYKPTTNQMSSESESESDAPKGAQKKISSAAKASTSKDSKYSKSRKLLSSDEESGNATKIEARKEAASILKNNLEATTSKIITKRVTKENKESKDNVMSPKVLKLRSRVIVGKDSKDSNDMKKKSSKSNAEENKLAQKLEETRELRSRNAEDKKYKPTTSQMSSESESESDAPKGAQNKISSAAKASTSKDSKYSKSRKLLSSDEESGNATKMKKGQDVWAEVYVESEESWICVSLLEKKIHCVTEIYKKATNPVLYVVAWNSAGTLKDVTRRYCPQWLTVTRKQRVDEKWWSKSLSYWKEKESALSKAEDEMLLQRELEQPLPKTVGECKGHPLYALQRHLLKYEALYPPDAVPLGHLKTGEAIYSRHCVHTLCSRETWVKKARVVKPGEESYKIVKAMPKYDKLSGMMIKDQPLELFGKWQTTQYVPPVAKDGIVPRNEYGNVDLFKMCMLPKGTVHINLPALNRVARKLNIDCAPAVVGFNFGGMGAVPAFEGFVVCEEFEDTLREAWETEQIEAAKRAREKRDKRIYGNWKKLIKGLLIREKLAAKYGFGNKEERQEDERPSASTKRPKQEKGGAKKIKL